MSKQTINIGASPNDGTGTPLRTSFDYTNQNFTELYTALGGGVGLPGATTQVIFNDGGTNLAGDAGLVYNKTTDALTVAGLVTAGSATITGALAVDTTTLVVNAAGYADRVGIGTATPGYPLEVVGNAVFSADATCKRFFVNDTTGNGNAYINSANGSQSFINLGGQTNYNNGAIIYDDASNFLAFRTNGVEAARFNSTGNLVLKGGTAAANGVGVTFPATQVASSDANTLDDYEEGTWTGGLLGVTTNPTVPVTATGSYTKIGRIVRISIQFSNVSTVGASGQLTVSGIPFTNSAIAAIGNAFIGNSIVTITGPVLSSIGSGASSNVDLVCQLSSGDLTTADHSAGTGKYLTINTVYTV